MRHASIRLSPSGQFAALACGNHLEVWELSSRTRRAALALTNDIWRVLWQPGAERLALGCYGGLFLWDTGATNAVMLRGGDIAITHLCFNQDGDLLFVGGWNELDQIPNTTRILEGCLTRSASE